MTTPRSVLTQNLVRAGAFVDDFTLFDIGASGGIRDEWKPFGASLIAYAFEPLVAEVQRLNSLPDRPPRVRYYDAFIVGPKGREAISDPALDIKVLLSRTSSGRALELAGIDYAKKFYNNDAEVQYSTNRYTIDEFASRESISTIDFIKTDTDGFDYSVLLGAETSLRDRGVLGLKVEVFFNLPDPESNNFSNVDKYLRSLGFSLYDLSVRRYSKAALPGRFRYDAPYRTLSGQVLWADAVYFRDLLNTNEPPRDVSPSRVLKLISLFEIFHLYDCAMELVNVYADAIAETSDPDEFREILLEEATGRQNYGEYMARFEQGMRAGRYALFADDLGAQVAGYLLQHSRNKGYEFVEFPD